MKFFFCLHILFFLIFSCSKDKTSETPSPVQQPPNSNAFDQSQDIDPELASEIQEFFGLSQDNEGEDTLEYLNEYPRIIRKLKLAGNPRSGLAAIVTEFRSGPDQGIGVCTGFLVSKNLLVTNSHCLPPELKVNPSVKCHTAINAVIPEYTGKNTIAACKRIISYSQNDNQNLNTPDYALIEVYFLGDKGKGMSLGREGFVDEQKTEIHSYDFENILDDQFVANYKKSNCFSYTGGIFGNFIGHQSTIIPLVPGDGAANQQCQFIPGNSGSPIQNSKGEVIGILYAGKKGRSVLIRRTDQNPEEALDELPKSWGLATNFSCLKFSEPSLDSNLSPSCKEFLLNEKERYQDFLKSQWEEAGANVEKKFQEALTTLPSSFEYKIIRLSETELLDTYFSYLAFPSCVKPLEEWDASEHEKIESQGPLGLTKTYTLSVPTFNQEFKFRIDRTLRQKFIYELEQKSGKVLEFKINGLHRFIRRSEGRETPLTIQSMGEDWTNEERRVIFGEVRTEIPIKLCE